MTMRNLSTIVILSIGSVILLAVWILVIVLVSTSSTSTSSSLTSSVMSVLDREDGPRNATRVYMAAGLFTMQELIGNDALCDAMWNLSKGKYMCILPQHQLLEAEHARELDIRNADLSLLLSCHAILANLNGLELDSGVVVEFMVSKFVDLPAVLLRTDFRRPDEFWNLMVSYWPRTQIVQLDSAQMYHRDAQREPLLLAQYVAQQVIQNLDQVLQQPSTSDLKRPVLVADWLNKLIHTTGPGPR